MIWITRRPSPELNRWLELEHPSMISEHGRTMLHIHTPTRLTCSLVTSLRCEDALLVLVLCACVCVKRKLREQSSLTPTLFASMDHKASKPRMQSLMDWLAFWFSSQNCHVKTCSLYPRYVLEYPHIPKQRICCTHVRNGT